MDLIFSINRDLFKLDNVLLGRVLNEIKFHILKQERLLKLSPQDFTLLFEKFVELDDDRTDQNIAFAMLVIRFKEIYKTLADS